MIEGSRIQKNKLLSLVKGMEAFIAIFDLDGTLIFANEASLQVSQLETSDVEGKKFWDCAWWNYDLKVQKAIQQDCEQAASGEHIHREIQLYTPQGLHWIKFNIQSLLDQDNTSSYLIAEGHSIEIQKQAEKEAFIHKTFYENLIDHLNVPAFAINKYHQVIIWNKACEILTGLKASEVLSSNLHWQGFYESERACLCDLVLDENYQQNLNLYKNHQPHPFIIDGKKTQNWCDLPNGKHLFLDIDACPIRDEDGQVTAVVEMLNDITGQISSEKALMASEQKYRTLFEKSADAFLVFEQGKFIDCNIATVNMLGYQNKDELLNKHPAELSPEKQADGRDSHEKAAEMVAIAIAQDGHRFEWNHLRKNNEVFPVEVLVTPITYGKRNVLHVVWRDITKRNQIEKQLQLIAHYDVLTHLPNRTLFIDRFNQAVALNKRSKKMLAVCFLDLDDFKPVNDGFGHSIGDQLLIEVSMRISSSIRDGDSVSRQGGDEFALLLCNLNSYIECEQLVKRIHIKLAKPYSIEDHVHNISVSTGITIFPDDDADLDTLLRHADQAMYEAKLEGKNRYHFFNIQDDEANIKRSDLLSRLRKALFNNELCLYYQPKVNMNTGHIFGVEALMRWIHPEKGMIPPLDFLPQIENTDLEIEIGGWVINQALKQLDSWLQQDIELEVSVNISSHQLQASIFYEQIDSALADYPAVDSHYLQLEILESSALGDIKAISHIIKRCQNELGVNVALDDFGTGYSSLTHLKDLTANTIKIDQSFVRDMLCDPDDYSIIQGVIGLANAFHRKIIAEGVETTEQGLALLLMGCYQAQGYGIARPMPADSFSTWLADYTINNQWVSYAAKDYSIEQRKIILFRLVTTCWFKKTLNKLDKSATSDALGSCQSHSRKCDNEYWFSRFKAENCFTALDNDNCEELYDEMSSLAKELILHYQSGNINAIKNGLEAFEKSFTKVNDFLINAESV